MPELSLNYRITQDDFIAAQRAHQQRNRSGRLQFKIGMFLFGWFLFLALFSVVFTPRVWLNYTLPLLLAASYLYLYYFAHRIAYRRNAGVFGDIRVDISDEGVHVVTSNSESTVPWARYGRWIESNKVFLLYMGERTFNIIPKRVLSPEQQEFLRGLLKREIVATAA